MGEVGVHLQHQPGAAGERPRGSRRCRRGRALPCAAGAGPRRSRAARRAGRRSRRSRPGELSSTISTRALGGSFARDGFDQRLDVLGLVVGRQDQPGGAAVGLGHRRDAIRRTPGGTPRVGSVTNAEIAAALEELGVLYELDGAVKYRVLAYSTAAKAIRESPVSVAELAAQGRGDRDPRRRQDAGGKDRRPDGDRRDPRRGEAEGEVPADPDRGHPRPRRRPENRPPPLRGARNLLDGGPQGRGRGGEDPRRQRPRRRRPRRTSSPRSSGSASRARGPAGCCSRR